MEKPTLGELVARRREALGMSQRELAKQVGTSTTTIWSAENNRYNPTKMETLARIAEVLEITTDELYAANRRIPPDIDELITQLTAEQLGRLRETLQNMTRE